MEVAICQRVKCVLEDKSISVNALSKQINVAIFYTDNYFNQY